jgi:long-subunit fatty acid transport protein
VPITARGTLALVPEGETAKSLATIDGDRARLRLTLPMELRVGARFRPLPMFGLNVDLVYEGWQSFSELVLTPEGITQQLGGSPPQPVEPIHIRKGFRHTLSARVGLEYRFFEGPEVRLGALYEPAAAPERFANVDFPHFGRVFLTAGGSYPLGDFELIAALAFLPSQTTRIDETEVRQTTADPSVAGGRIGFGTYDTGGLIGSIGLRGAFGE